MGYFLASIISISAALVIILTRYTGDDTSVQSEVEYLKEMVYIVDDYVNTYIESGGLLENVNITTLNDDGILLAESTVLPVATPADPNNRTLSFNNHEDYVFMVIPSPTNANAYELFIDFTRNNALMSKSGFVESLIRSEFCEKGLFGDFQGNYNSYNTSDERFNTAGTRDDGLAGCIIYK